MPSKYVRKTKKCPRCGRNRKLHNFSMRLLKHKDGTSYNIPQSWCKDCHNEAKRMARPSVVKVLRDPLPGYVPSRSRKGEVDIAIVQRELGILLQHMSPEELARSMGGLDPKRFRVLLSGRYYSSKANRWYLVKKVSIDVFERILMAGGKTLHDVPEYDQLQFSDLNEPSRRRSKSK